MVRINPETPRESADETRRDLDNLRSEVTEWESTWVDTLEQLENDAEVKSGFEKILNKSFEETVSNFEQELPNDFTVDGYLKSITETNNELWLFIAWPLRLQNVFLWSKVNFKKLTLEQKINFITLKKSIDKLTSWGNDLSKISFETIEKEASEQGKTLINNADKYLEWKPLSTLKSLWLTDSEYNKIVTILRQKWVIKGDSNTDDEEIIYGEDGTNITEKKRGFAVSGTVLAISCIFSAIVGGGVSYYIRWRDKSTTDKTKTWPTSEVKHRDFREEAQTLSITHSSTMSFNNAETIYPDRTFWNKVKECFYWREYAELQCHTTMAAGFKWADQDFDWNPATRTITITTDKPTISVMGTSSKVLDSGWSLIRWANRNVQTHAIKLCENAMMMNYAWYTYDDEEEKLVVNNPAKQRQLERDCANALKKQYERVYGHIGVLGVRGVSKIEVKYRPNSKIRLSLEDRNVDSLGDNRPRPRKDDKEHYVKM